MFAILSTLIEERTGLHYGLADHDRLLDRVEPRAVEAGFETLLDYYYFLRYDPEGPSELDRLADSLVVNETYFFRELDPLRVVVAHFIEPLVRAGHRPRVWCAACASGEEPLTLAMLLAEADLLGHTEIIASDISVRALDRARAGRFGRRSIRGVPDLGLGERWLTHESGGEILVREELLRAIDWRRINLRDEAAVSALGTFDVILCRNVLIYFKDDTVVRVLTSLSGVLRPGGALFVGISESLLRHGTSLVCEERDRSFYYRKAP